MKENTVDMIINYGKRYREEELASYKMQIFLDDWWKAVIFFLNRASFQGRRDDVSSRVYKRIKSVLALFFDTQQKDVIIKEQRSRNWKDIKDQLKDQIGKGKVGKGRDIAMVISVLDYIYSLPEYNIAAYSISQIKQGLTVDYYRKLQRQYSSSGIIQVGPKIASFYLRDLISICELDAFIDEEAAFCLQPVDVWVRRFAQKTGLVEGQVDDQTIQQAIIEVCKEYNCSPLLFNQGAWYIGTHSFDLLLELISSRN